MGEQLQMQKEDYEFALTKGEVFLCEKCGALTIATCEDVKKGECFYCGSKDVSWDKKRARIVLEKRVAEGIL